MSALCFRIELPEDEAGRVLAELHSLGTLGVEERTGPSGPLWLAYFDAQAADSALICALADTALGVRVSGPEEVADADWEREWRAGLAPRRVGELWIRPSWCASQGAPELVIDPQQAFGSGEHATTRLSLEMLQVILEPGDRVLDLGAGSGILALAALRLGAARALGIEIDPVACRNARANAISNGLELELFCGRLDGVRADTRVELGVANMLWDRLDPWVESLAAHSTRALIVSGFLVAQRDTVAGRLSELGWRLEREGEEEQSGDRWGVGLWVHA